MLVICGLMSILLRPIFSWLGLCGGMTDPQLPHELFQALHVNRWDIR